MITTLTYTIVEKDIDEYEHVNYLVYIKKLTKGRMEWFKEAGFSEKNERERKMGTVVLKLEITYLKEMLLGDELIITTEPDEIGTKSFSLKQTIKNSSGEIMTKSTTKLVMLDLDKRVSIPVIDEIANKFK